MANTADYDLLIRGQWTFTVAPAFPAGKITNADIISNAGISATKLQHQHSVNVELFEKATAIIAQTKLLYICRGATGLVIQAEAAMYVQATGADRTVSIDIQKSTGGGAFATIMTAVIAITNATAIFTAVEGTVNATPAALVDGDILQAVISVSGAAGAQAKGLLLTVTLREDAE